MRKKLLHNWTLKLASLILALVIWFVIIQIDKPLDTVSFSNIKVTLTNTELLEEKNKVYEILDNTDNVGRVTVKAPSTITDKLRASDIIAEADVSKLTDINTIAITYYVLNADVYSVEGNREVLKLNVEDKSSKWIKVKYETVGDVAEGYMITSASPDQTLIEITGPVSSVEQVSYAGVQIGVEGATNSISANVDVNLYNAEGELLQLPNITKNVNYVLMSVEVLAVKEVPVEIRIKGTPREGYMTTGEIEYSTDTVLLAGPPSALNNVSKIVIPAEQMDISEATEDVVKSIDIKDYLPENVRLANGSFNGKVKITVHVEEIVTKNIQIPVANINIQNLPTGLTAAYPTDLIECVVTVSGLGKDVNPLRYYNILGYVDVAAWMQEKELTELEAGSYNVPVTFVLNEKVSVENDVTLPIIVEKTQ